jgi:hypothetical protein
MNIIDMIAQLAAAPAPVPVQKSFNQLVAEEAARRFTPPPAPKYEAGPLDQLFIWLHGDATTQCPRSFVSALLSAYPDAKSADELRQQMLARLTSWQKHVERCPFGDVPYMIVIALCSPCTRLGYMNSTSAINTLVRAASTSRSQADEFLHNVWRVGATIKW